MLFASVVLTLFGTTMQASAQNQAQWQPDQRVPGYLDNTFTPYMVADQNRTVHVFASQIINEFTLQRAVVYRQWSLAGGWTKTTDILVSPSGDAIVQGAFLDAQGMLHVIFWGGDPENANIYYSKAPAQSAGASSAWSRPIIIGGTSVETTSASIQGDDNGNLAVIYNGQRVGYGVYETHSSNGGNTWSKATSLYLTYDQTLLPFSLRLAVGRYNRIHATWSVVTVLGEDRSLHYASFDLDKSEWNPPITLNEKTEGRSFFGPSYPSMVDTGAELVIMYNSGNPFEGLPVGVGRPVQMVSVSKDNGDTWEVPVVPFYRHNGRSGEHAIVKDSENSVHAIFVQRIEYPQDGKNVVVGGIWHSAYKDGKWSVPERFIPSVPSSNIHAVVSQGNVILAVWIEDQGTGQSGVWYSYLKLDVKEDPVAFNPTLPATLPVEPDTAAVQPATSTSTPFPERLLQEPLIKGKSGSSVVFGVVLVLVALIALLVFRGRQR